MAGDADGLSLTLDTVVVSEYRRMNDEKRMSSLSLYLLEISLCFLLLLFFFIYCFLIKTCQVSFSPFHRASVADRERK